MAGGDNRSGAADPAEPGAAGSMDNCPYCLLRADLGPPPPCGLSVARPVPAGQVVPVLSLQSAQPLLAWHVGQPLAPPGAA